MNLRIARILSNILFFLNCLLVFLLIFEDKLVLPAFLQVSGRMHPLLLHFPLVLLVMYALWGSLGARTQKTNTTVLLDGLLLAGAFTAVITAITGLFLSREEGYDISALQWHKYTGSATALVSFLCYTFRAQLQHNIIAARSISALLLVLVLAGGHLGATITHGENFLTGPLHKEKEVKAVPLSEAVLFTDVVQPILTAKCANCHNKDKAKGQLDLTTVEGLLKGGKNGLLWDTTRLDLGNLIHRISLPEEEKKHMPPKGKPQFTPDEIMLLEAWVRHGSDLKSKVASLSPSDPLFVAAAKFLSPTTAPEQYNFSAVSDDELAAVNTNYRVIAPVASGSPGLNVSFYNRAGFKSSDLDELSGIKNQIVSMDLSKMPLKDEDLQKLTQFKNIRKLIINFTDITGKTLGSLKSLGELRSLSLTGTKVKASDLNVLKDFPKLTAVYAWQVDATAPELAKLQKALTHIELQTGFQGDTIHIKLSTPIIDNEGQILTGKTNLKIRHPVPGVILRYTLDGRDPDSTHSSIYNGNLEVAGNVNLKVAAFKTGWYGSKVIERYFFRATHHPDSVRLLTEPSKQYPAQKETTLSDGIKSDANARSGKWLGYREHDLQSILIFDQPISATSVTVSYLCSINGYIFPPSAVEIWGGVDKNHLKKLSVVNEAIPLSSTPKEPKNRSIEVKLPPTSVRYLKVVAKRFPKLPLWHPGKGQSAWVFVDEIFVN